MFMIRRILTLALVAIAALTFGCSGDEGPSSGEATRETGSSTADGRSVGEASSDADTPTLSGVVQPVFDARCASQSCHGVEKADLHLATGVSHGELVSVYSVQVPSWMRVLPGRPDSSYLVVKLADDPPGGNRMPIGQPPLPADEIAAIRDWIEAGAADN
jgi:hypothetical protein